MWAECHMCVAVGILVVAVQTRVHSITSVTFFFIINIVHVSQKASLRASSALSAVNAQDTSVADLCKTLLNITVMDTAD